MTDRRSNLEPEDEPEYIVEDVDPETGEEFFRWA